MKTKLAEVAWLIFVAVVGIAIAARIQPASATCFTWGGGAQTYCYEQAEEMCVYFCWTCWCVEDVPGCYWETGDQWTAGCEDYHPDFYCPCE